MAGVKGRSGRRSMQDWEKRYKIIDKAWDIASAYINDESIELSKRIEVAIKILVKDMPDKLTDGDGEPLQAPIVNVYGTRNTNVHTAESSRSITGSEQAV